MNTNKYYDGSKLLSLKDQNKRTPEIYICTGNRTSGKTTYFSKHAVKRFLKKHEKFTLLYRFIYELDDVSDKFFKDIGGLFFQGYTMHSKRMASGIYHELFLEYPDSTEENPHVESCGYAIAINGADQIKKYSHLLSDTQLIIFDEFQSESGHYCSNEIKKLMSIHTSMARGQGNQSRRLPLIMISNNVSIINPYFAIMSISNRLLPSTHFLRGDGWVLEQNNNENASKALQESSFIRAFSKDSYATYATSGKYLNDYDAFIEKMPEYGKYVVTIRYKEKEYSIKEYADKGIMYVSDSVDKSFPFRLAIDLNDHEINYVLLSRNDMLIQQLRTLFEHGCVRFKNQLCKDAFMTMCSYKYLI